MGMCLEKSESPKPEMLVNTGRTYKMNIHALDPRLPDYAQRTVTVTGDITIGPQCDEVRLVGGDVEPNDADGNFLFDAPAEPDVFDGVHTFAVVMRVVNLYQRTLERLGERQALRWQWGHQPLALRPYAGERPMAWYSRENADIALFHIKTPTRTKETLYLCRSFDVVAHMAGHAVLDALKPTFYGSGVTEEVRALHEAFADLAAVFVYLSQLEVCEQIMASCGGDLARLADYVAPIEDEELAAVFGREFGLRNVQLDVKLSDVVAEQHDWSRTLTSAVYQVLVRMCSSDELGPTAARQVRQPAERLHLSASHLCGVVLRAYLDAPIFEATLRDVAQCMEKAESDSKVRAIMKEEFKRRRFYDKTEMPKRWNGVNKLGGCMTMAERGSGL